MKIREKGKKIIKELIIVFLMALLVEIFVFNHRAFSTAAYDEKYLDESYEVELVGGYFDENGDIVMNCDAGFVALNITGLGYPISNIKLDVECLDDEVSPYEMDHACAVECLVYDGVCFEKIGEDGQSYLQESAVAVVEQDILHSVSDSHYIYMIPMGEANFLQIVMYPESGVSQRLRIHNLSFNSVKPFHFSPARFLLLVLLGLFIYAFFINRILWQVKILSGNKCVGLLMLAVFIVFSFFSGWLVISNKALISEQFSPYSELARAICKGHLYVEEASEEISAIEDRLIFWREDSSLVKFDYSLYRGKYYVYFGVLPCVLFYLPYFLLTGRDIPNVLVELVLQMSVVALLGQLLAIIIKRFYGKTPVALYLLLWGALVSGAYIPAMLTGTVKFYDIPILSGLSCTLAGACFYAGLGDEEDKIPVGRLAGGSICMAAASLCRPLFLLYAIVYVFFLVRNRVSFFKRMSKDRKIKLLSALILPYIFFAIICMLYNQLRFGSLFDFGVAYNTTSIPVKEKALFFPYVVFRCVYEYLLYPPYISFDFPYTKFVSWQVIKEAGNIMVRDVFCGGLITSNPFTWSLVLMGYYRKSLKKKRILGIMMAVFMVAFFIMVYGTICTSSIYTRYTMDFSSAVLIGACIVILEIYDDISVMNNKILREGLERVIAFVLMVSILWGAMQFCCGEKSIWSLETGNTELWGRIYYAFRLFG